MEEVGNEGKEGSHSKEARVENSGNEGVFIGKNLLSSSGHWAGVFALASAKPNHGRHRSSKSAVN